MANPDRWLAALEDRHARRYLWDEDDPEMAEDEDDRLSRIDRLAAAAEARWESDRDD